MGILNVTPDSFSDGGLYASEQEAVAAALRMVDEGADLIDVGAESTRPGSQPISLEEELKRALPVVRELVNRGAAVSIDTQKPEVARAAINAGAQIVNDVSGLRNPHMLEICAEYKPNVCIMHMQGTPETMQQEPSYKNVVNEVLLYLLEQARKAEEAGVAREKIWIDPGIGFGKTVEHNLALLKNLEEFTRTEFPVLIGVSRKGFLGKIAIEEGELPVTDRLEPSLALQALAQIKGVRIIRAHDVKQARRVINSIVAVLAV